jgi:hypothetical protein
MASRILAIIFSALLIGAMCGCPTNQTTIRRAGQSELYAVDVSDSFALKRTLPGGSNSMSWSDFSGRPQHVAIRQFGDPIRTPDDIVTVQVLSAHVHDVYRSLPMAPDIILFSEVWENSAHAYGAEALNRIIHVGQSQALPARLNFEGNLAYGPTGFKGTPLRIKFTLMVLQKRQGEEAATAADVVSNFVSASSVVAPYGGFASEAISVVREILRSLPDVIAFDFEITLLSDAPQVLMPTIIQEQVRAQAAPMVLQSLVRQLAFEAENGEIQASTVHDIAESIELLDETKGEEAWRTLSDTLLEYEEHTTRILQDVRSLLKTNEELLTPGDLAWLRDPDSEERREYFGSGISTYDLEQLLAAMRETELDTASLSRQSQQLHKLLTSISEQANVMDEQFNSYLIERQENRDRDREDEEAAFEIVPVQSDPWHWLQYGIYAIVETKPRRGNNAMSIPLDAQLRFDGGWLRFDEDTVLDSALVARKGDRVQANYIVFAVIPGQLNQENPVLLAASNADKELMATLRQSQEDAAKAASGLTNFAKQLSERIIRSKVESTARSTVVELERGGMLTPDTFSNLFEKRMDLFEYQLDEGAIDPHELTVIRQEILDQWMLRIMMKQAADS